MDPYPPRDNDEPLLQMVDIYLAKALPIKTEFIAHELPSDFLERLTAAKAAFQAAIAGRLNAVGDRIAARNELDDALARGVEIVRKLTSLMKVKYADTPGVLIKTFPCAAVQNRANGWKAAPP